MDWRYLKMLIIQNNRLLLTNTNIPEIRLKNIQGFSKTKKGFTFSLDIWTIGNLLALGVELSKEVDEFRRVRLEQYKNMLRFNDPEFKSNIKFNSFLDGVLELYQKNAVEFFCQVKKGILGDEMGLGKSLVALATLEKIQASKVILICPAYLKYNWRRETVKWMPGKNIFLCDGSKDKRTEIIRAFNQSETGILIVNYEMFQKENKTVINKRGNQVKKLVNKFPFPKTCDAVVIDECHHLRNHKIYFRDGIMELDSPYIFMMTGTPLNKRPVEMYGLLNVLDPKRFTSFWGFANYYFTVVKGTFGGFDILGFKKEKEYQRVLSEYMLRRVKADVKELPEKIIHEISIVLGDQHQRCYNSLFSYRTGDNQPIESNMELYIRLGQCVYSPELVGFKNKESTLFNTASELYKDIYEGEQIIISSDSKIGAELLYKNSSKYFKNKVIFFITGSTPVKRRDEILTKFEQEKESILICTIRSIAEGYNLDFVKKIIFLDIPFSNNKLLQFFDRIHRMTTTEVKEYYHLIVNNTCQAHKYYKIMEEIRNNSSILKDTAQLKKIIAYDYLERNNINEKKK